MTDRQAKSDQQAFLEGAQARATPINSLEFSSDNTAIALQLADNYYNNYRHRLNPATSKYVGLNGREIAMARNTLWAMNQRPDAKVIVINHVIHTKTASQYQGNFTPMGQLLKQELGNDLYIIGMSYGGGQFWNNWQRPAEGVVDDIRPYQPEGFETVMSAVGHSQFFIDFDSAPAEALSWFNTETILRESDYFIRLEPGSWNGCIYLDRVSPATAV